MYSYSGFSVSYLADRQWGIPVLLTDHHDLAQDLVRRNHKLSFDRAATITKATDWFVSGFLNWRKKEADDGNLRQLAWDKKPFFPLDTIECGRDAEPYYSDLASIFGQLMLESYEDRTEMIETGAVH